MMVLTLRLARETKEESVRKQPLPPMSAFGQKQTTTARPVIPRVPDSVRAGGAGPGTRHVDGSPAGMPLTTPASELTAVLLPPD
jgi:hypothetical protein